jgi:hypothetical protein
MIIHQKSAKRAKLVGMSVRNRPFVCILLVALLLPVGGLWADIRSPVELRGSVSGGSSLQDLRSESYDAKLLPTVGCSLAVFTMKEKPLNYGATLSYDHVFRSNDKNFYYYSSYERFAFTPTIELSFPRRGTRFYVSGGLGFNIAFSGYSNKAFIASTVDTGIHFQKSFFNGIMVSYSHGFLNGYRAFETFRAGMVFRLIEKEMR